MATTHFVRDFGFDVSFASESEAFDQHTRLGSFVSERLVAVADEVFAKLNPADGSVLRIDEMEIDLGDISPHGYYTQAEQRFRKQLEEQIHRNLHLSLRTVVSLGQESAELIVSAAQNEFDIVVWWMEHGYLPWNVSSLGGSALQQMLGRVVERDGARFVARLRHSGRLSDIARRLAWQAPKDLLGALAKLLRPDTSLPFESDNWESLLLQLLREECDADDLQDIVQIAIVTGDADLLRAHWEKLFEEDAAILESVLRQEGVRQEVRWAMAASFPDPLLGSIVKVLEPQESGFIAELTRRPEIFREAAKQYQESAVQAKTNLWEFTFSYLLVERGSSFNRRAYLESTVRHMAAHYNQDYRDLLASLIDTVDRTESASALKTGMLSLLSELNHDSLAPPLHSRTLDLASALEQAAEQVEAQIRKRTGLHGLGTFLAGLTRSNLAGQSGQPPNNHFYIASLIRQAADRYRFTPRSLLHEVATVLDHITLPEPLATELRSILHDLQSPWMPALEHAPLARDPRLGPSLLEIVEPIASAGEHSEGVSPPRLRPNLAAPPLPAAAAELVSGLLQTAENFEQSLRHQSSFRGIIELVAGFTRNYLTYEEDNRFDKHLYIASLIRQAADRYDLNRKALLVGITVALNQIALPAHLAAELMPILRELQAPWTEYLERMLLTGDTRLLKRIAANESVRGAMMDHLRPSVLRDLAQIFEPAAAALMCEIADQPQLFERALPRESPPAIRRSMWEFTFEYAVRDRGSSFDRLSYSEYVIGKLAAHSNLRYEDLLVSLCDTVQSARLSQHVTSELVSILSTLAKRKGLAPPQSKAEKMQTEIHRDRSLVQLLAEVAESPSAQLLQSVRTRFSRWLSEPETTSALERSKIVGAMERLLDRPPDWFLSILRSLLADPLRMHHLIASLPEKQLARILPLVAPNGSQRLLHLAEVIADSVGGVKPELKWQFLFPILAHQGRAISEKEFLRRYMLWLASKKGARSAGDLAILTAQRLRMAAASSANGNEFREIANLLAPAMPVPQPVRKSRPIDFCTQQIFIRNAGLVLAAPYIPRLFAMTGLLEENKFRDDEAACRGIHLLQYLVDGAVGPPEHLLPLNKILCGLQPDEPIHKNIELTLDEKQAAESLLDAMIAHWSILGNTSLQGLRESFLQREGRLSFAKDAWQLLVQPRAFDMLLDKLPWGFKVTRYSWMQAPLHVEWR